MRDPYGAGPTGDVVRIDRETSTGRSRIKDDVTSKQIRKDKKTRSCMRYSFYTISKTSCLVLVFLMIWSSWELCIVFWVGNGFTRFLVRLAMWRLRVPSYDGRTHNAEVVSIMSVLGQDAWKLLIRQDGEDTD
mgnify:CR=1 FL=1